MRNILLLGSSFIKRIPELGLGHNFSIVNNGIYGVTTDIMVKHMYIRENVYSQKNFEYIVFYCGDNDLTNGVNKKTVCVNIAKFINILRELYPNSKIIVISLLKSPLHKSLGLIPDIEYINVYLYNMCKIYSNMFYININRKMNNQYETDKTHLNSSGYEIVKYMLRQYIQH